MMKEKGLTEHQLVADVLGTENLKINFGRLDERATDRKLFVPKNEVCFFYVVEGAIRVTKGKNAQTMVEGEAILLEVEVEYMLTNPRSRPSFYFQMSSPKI
jgi:glyoxylate utilization-related uncharacterized protein